MNMHRRPSSRKRESESRPRSSRRTLSASAIASLAVVAIAIYTVAMLRAGLQRSAVERVWERGGYVARASESRDPSARPPAWYQALLGDEFMNAVLAVRLAGTRAGDDDLAHLGRLRRIQFLDLTDTPISDRGLRHVSRRKQLSVLALNGTSVSDAGLVELFPCANLRVNDGDCRRPLFWQLTSEP